MNTIVTSRQQLLDSAKQIAVEQGVSSISIRAVAQKSGVSVGALYHYFTSKSELVVAVIDDFWQAAFRDTDWEELSRLDFISCFTAIYQALEVSLRCFQENWLTQTDLLEKQEKELGKQKEADYFNKIRRTLTASLRQDPKLAHRSWKEPVTQERLVELAFVNMLLQLRRKEGCETLVAVLQGFLYG